MGLLTFLGAISIICSIYILFSKNLFRTSIFLFFQVLSISAIVLKLDYSIVGIFLIFMSFVLPLIFLSFSGSMVGELNTALHLVEEKAKFKSYVGLGIGIFLFLGLINYSAHHSSSIFNGRLEILQRLAVQEQLEKIGSQFLEKRFLILHLLGACLLTIVFGCSIFWRRLKRGKR